MATAEKKLKKSPPHKKVFAYAQNTLSFFCHTRTQPEKK